MDQAHRTTDSVLYEMDKHMQDSMLSLKKDIIELLVKIDPNPNVAREMLHQQISNTEYDKMLELFFKTKDKGLKQELKKKLKVEALKPRISRKGALYSAIDRKRIEITDYQLNSARKHLKRTILTTSQLKAQDYHRAFAFVDDDYVNRILNSSWLGSDFSSRIWNNQVGLAEALKESIVQQYITGKSPNLIGRDLLVDGSKANAYRYNVARIMRTETSYIVNKTELEDAKRLGITKRQFVANIDSRTSDVCKNHHKNIIPIEECVIGKNVPPLHPFCRSYMVDYIPGLSDESEWGNEEKIYSPLKDREYSKINESELFKIANNKKSDVTNYQVDVASAWIEHVNKDKGILKQDLIKKFNVSYEIGNNKYIHSNMVIWDKDLTHIISKHSREKGFRIEDILNIKDRILDAEPIAINQFKNKDMNGHIFYLDAGLGRAGKIEIATKGLPTGDEEIIHIQYMKNTEYHKKMKKLKKRDVLVDKK